MPHSVSLWQHTLLEIIGYNCAIHAHHPALSPLGANYPALVQAASQSTAVAPGLLV